jgi:methylthioribose-1-phosphate isomerase
VQTDGAAASTILRGLVDVAIIGADRIARNGDTANKIGSVAVALACHAAGIPFVVAAPSSTVDLNTASGADIHIEERDGDEVTVIADQLMTPVGARGFNPAFDVTPQQYISVIVTERGVVVPRDAHAADALTGGIG